MFNNVVTALRSEHPMEVIYQLDVSTSQRRFEFEGEKQIRDFYVELVPALLLRIITKKSAAEPLFLAEYPIKVNLKSETPTDDGIKTVPTTKHHRYRFKQRFSFVLEEMGCRVDCTVVQLTMYQSANTSVREAI
jgi:hypothetical protein